MTQFTSVPVVEQVPPRQSELAHEQSNGPLPHGFGWQLKITAPLARLTHTMSAAHVIPSLHMWSAQAVVATCQVPAEHDARATPVPGQTSYVQLCPSTGQVAPSAGALAGHGGPASIGGPESVAPASSQTRPPQ